MNEEQETPDLEWEVAVWLREHPEFFTRHPELAESLRVPHPCRPAVSLLEYQNRLLRERCQRLHDKLVDLVAIARDNDRLAERVQRLALSLLDAPGEPDELLRGVKAILRDEFSADRAILCMAGLPATRSKIAAEFLCPDVAALFEDLFQVGQPHCGRLRPEQALVLFGDSAPRVASAALIPLGGGEWRGLLGLGSWDEDRFYPGVGTLFLGRIGELISQALQARLVTCQWRAVSDSPSVRGR